MLFLTENQLSCISHSILVKKTYLVYFSFQLSEAGSERWPWIRQRPRRGWGLLFHELHNWAAAAIQALLELSLRSFLGAGWGNSTVVQNSWPLGDETPLAWIIKAQKDCSEKSTLTSAWGRSHLLESTLRSLGNASHLAKYAQSSGFLVDEMHRCCVPRAPSSFSH